ncbi:unnamed protein product [Paramecium pentaurelia]|uniref:Uncharacterized protein n=1 Tax=Paramecium pentaurelia TaxID=43138 RepID=A0A8S1RXL8_9CILI|nr:unnamed protein product [Paramecium pentaurelia]
MVMKLQQKKIGYEILIRINRGGIEFDDLGIYFFI